MAAPLLKLTGVGEGIEICVETILKGADSPAKISEAILQIFPLFPIEQKFSEPTLGNGSNYHWKASKVDLSHFLKLLHQQRILDTALDAMSKNLKDGKSVFHLSRQAAMVGKVAFPLPDEIPLGGTITITLASAELGDWLEAATWHPGRDKVPRTIGDEKTMAKDGEAATWL